MIFGWLEYGRTDRWVMIDPVFPWPALHHGRSLLRNWADFHNRARATQHTAGPRRMPWPCKTAVKESGHAELRIWPCQLYGEPRAWGSGDGVWRDAIPSLAELMRKTVACNVTIDWQMGGPIERAPMRVVSLADQKGFIGWQRGEHEPKRLPVLEGGKVSMSGADIRVMPQGERAWH